MLLVFDADTLTSWDLEVEALTEESRLLEALEDGAGKAHKYFSMDGQLPPPVGEVFWKRQWRTQPSDVMERRAHT